MLKSCLSFPLIIWIGSVVLQLNHASAETSLVPTKLRCEYRQNPLGIDEAKPRLNWQVESGERGQKQTAYQVVVASSQQQLQNDKGDLWDSGKVESSQTIQIEYDGQQLNSSQACFWKVKVWDRSGAESDWSEPASWSMGLLEESDWAGDYISYQDDSPIHADRDSHYLPPARQYRKDFKADKTIKRATVYATALGIYELQLNGRRVSDHYFAPGWTDYRQRAYYNTYDVTDLVKTGDNAIGATVADGWYSGYVGFGLLVSIGTEANGRSIYGKTPSLLAQLEIEFDDGSKQLVVTDKSWKVTGEGPLREADLLMGEFYDARREQSGWSKPGFDDSQWDEAILASEAGPQAATFYEFVNPPAGKGGPKIEGRPIDLGFQRPRLEAFPGLPVRNTEVVRPISMTQRGDGNYIFDLGQNFAGTIRLKLEGPEGHKVKIRYGEMLHPDGRLMTENLRRARATDFYVCRGGGEPEVYSPRFTFHGFQFVEVTNFPGQPTIDSIDGLVLHSDTPMTSTFECSDPMVNQLYSNVLWTQRSNFIDLPTDCPQRDERMGWTGDAQAYVATAAYNADIGAFFTKWNRELMESQRPSGAFPGYAPYPFQHGWDFGTAWADAGIICPWTIWQVYDDTRMIDRCWQPMTRFMDWRKQTSVNDLGVKHGNAWGDWLNQGEDTPLDYIDSVYFAISTKMMAEMAEATGRDAEATGYRDQLQRTTTAFRKKYVKSDGSLNISTQTAYALALQADLIPADMRLATGEHLAKMLAINGNHMATGFLGTRPLLPVLSAAGQHDLATFLLQSHEFPSWGYEIDQGATTIWERWDSYTKEDGFGRHNAAMNSFSHYSFGAVCEWMFRTLAGIESDGPGYQKVVIHPHPPSPGSNAQADPIDWVDATYDSIRGTIASQWKVSGDQFELKATIPANTTATVYIPATDAAAVTESGKPVIDHDHIRVVAQRDGRVILEVESGIYQFVSMGGLARSDVALQTSVPADRSINPDNYDLSTAEVVASWDLRKDGDLADWSMLQNVRVEQRGDKAFLVATGPDPQMSTTLPRELSGMLALEVRLKPARRTEVEFYWASAEGGFSHEQRVARKLRDSQQTNGYIFRIGDDRPLKSLRFDPLGGEGEMEIESLTIYQLPDWQSNLESDTSHARTRALAVGFSKTGSEASMEAAGNTSDSEEMGAADQAPASAASATRPNILFVLTEDQGAHLSLLGTAGLKTPNMDALARSGTYFNNAFVVYSVCSASKAAIYTGLHCHTNGILNNTPNFHKPADKLVPKESNHPLYKSNRIKPEFLTLTEILAANDYYQGVTHKLHVAPVEKFPYDEFMQGSRAEIDGFLKRAKDADRPWFLMVNIPNSHRPYPNSDREPIRVSPNEVELPAYLPDTPVIRKDWAEYLAGIEEADALTGRAMDAVKQAQQWDNTIVVFLGDHGPTYPHGKMTLHDLGLRVPMIISGPGVARGKMTDELASELDLLPTLLEMIESGSSQPVQIPAVGEHSATKSSLPYPLHGKSIVGVLKEQPDAAGHDAIFAEISNRGVLPNDGIQERSVFDGRWKLIYRENVEKRWRQVNADSRQMKPWGNRTYKETIRLKDQFPEQYRVLQEQDPQNLDGEVPALELYDLDNDPDEMNNLANDPKHADVQETLMQKLRDWVKRTDDVYVSP